MVEKVCLGGLPVEVDVLRGSCSLGEPQVERESALQQPAVGCGGGKAGEQSVEGNALAVAREARSVLAGAGLQSLLECLAE